VKKRAMSAKFSIGTPRTLRIGNLDAIINRAKRYLKHQGIRLRSVEYKRLVGTLDIPSWQAAVSNWLQAFNLKSLRSKPRESANPDPRYQGKLPLYGAMVILLRAPELRERLAQLEGGTVHVDEAAEWMETFRILGLAYLTINLPGAEKEVVRRKNKEISGKPRQDGLQRVILDIVMAEPELTWKKVLKKLEGWPGIDSVTDQKINWTYAGSTRSSPISGLKDRVHRAKANV
jgi:hypothetical protein